MANSSRTYSLGDPAVLAAKIKQAGGPELDPTQHTGQASADGVTMGWDIEGSNIRLTILKKPFFIPESNVWSHADELFTA